MVLKNKTSSLKNAYLLFICDKELLLGTNQIIIIQFFPVYTLYRIENRVKEEILKFIVLHSFSN